MHAAGHDLREQTYAALQRFFPPQFAHLPHELRVVIGDPAERIMEMAEHDRADLLVLGMQEHLRRVQAVLGNTAESVARRAPCAVLLVKLPTAEKKSWLQDFYATFLPPSHILASQP